MRCVALLCLAILNSFSTGVRKLIVGEATCLCHCCDIVYNLGLGS